MLLGAGIGWLAATAWHRVGWAEEEGGRQDGAANGYPYLEECE